MVEWMDKGWMGGLMDQWISARVMVNGWLRGGWVDRWISGSVPV